MSATDSSTPQHAFCATRFRSYDSRDGQLIVTNEANDKFERALNAIRRNRLEEARALLTEVVLLDATHVDALSTLGALLLDCGDFGHALETLERALLLEPRSARIHLLASVALERCDKITDAMREAEIAASIEATWPEVQRQIGKLRGRAGDRQGCIEAWRRVVELTAGKDRESLNALGIAYSNNDRHPEAIAMLERAASLETPSASMLADLGIAQLRAGRVVDAKISCTRAIELEAGCAQAHLGLGMVLAQLKSWGDSVRELRVAVKLAPASPIAHLNLGLVLEAAGDREAARVALLRAAALAPDDVGIATLLQRVLNHDEREARTSANSISGDLMRFPITNLLEFLRMQTQSGSLTVTGPSGVGVVNMYEGRIVSVSSPRAQRLGEMLLERRLLTREQFDRALLEQTSVSNDPQGLSYFGAIVLRHGWLSKEVLREVVLEQVLTALNEIITWQQGSFSFQNNEGQNDPKPALTFDLQHTILELFRRRDEYEDPAISKKHLEKKARDTR